MAKRVRAIVKPELLTWARESIGLSLEIAAKKIGVKLDKLIQWESGEASPTVNQLRKAANAYKRPLAVFYLQDPPKTFEAIRDFRRLHDELPAKHSPELNLAIRRAHMRREIAIEIADQLGYRPTPLHFDVSLANNAEAFADEARRMLGIELDDQFQWRNKYQALNSWIGAFERLGALVFQTSTINITEMRGFSIAEEIFPVVVINAKDSHRGRIFTLMHELTHLLLNNGGLCDLREYDDDVMTEENRFEVFSNQVAASILVPSSALLEEQIVSSAGRRATWSDEDLRFLSDKYYVSQEVILRRLVTLGLASPTFYQRKREEFLEVYERLRRQKIEGFPPFHRVAIRDLGRSYIRLVLEAYQQDAINSADVSDFLGLRLKHLPNIERELIGIIA